jgi:hypothetical protein
MGITSASWLFSGVASTCRHRKPNVVVVGTCVWDDLELEIQTG